MEDATIVKAARVALYALNRPKFLYQVARHKTHFLPFLAA